MNAENSRKIKLLKMWEILKSETDEDHPISTPDLIARLEAEGISVDRKILYKDIELLNENGYEVLCERGKSNKYYVVDRSFNQPEVRILMDAVQAVSFVTEKKAEELIGKIAVLAGSRRGKLLRENITKYSTVKGTNETIYYSVDTILEAIKKKKKISFMYADYNVKRERVNRRRRDNPDEIKIYIVNPVTTFIDNDQYYLICYDDKHGGKLANYRIDRMDKVKILEEQITPNESVDIAKNMLQQFGMFGGDVKKVEFEADRSTIDGIFDKFGNNIRMSETKDGKLYCTVEVQVSPNFISWCCSFGKKVRVISPPSVIEKIREHIDVLKEIYEEKTDA